MDSLRSLAHPKTKIQWVINDRPTDGSTSPLASSSGKKASILLDSEDGITLSSIPAHVHLLFPGHVGGATHLAMTFQGGFAPTSAMVYVAPKHKEGSADVDLGLIMGSRIHIADNSKRQVFKIPYPGNIMIPRTAAPPASQPSQNPSEPNIVTEVPPENAASSAAQQPNGNSGGEAEEYGVPEIMELKIEFEGTTDNQGRITLYQIEVLG